MDHFNDYAPRPRHLSRRHRPPERTARPGTICVTFASLAEFVPKSAVARSSLRESMSAQKEDQNVG